MKTCESNFQFSAVQAFFFCFFFNFDTSFQTKINCQPQNICCALLTMSRIGLLSIFRHLFLLLLLWDEFEKCESTSYNYQLSDDNKFIRVGSNRLHNWTEAETYCENTFGLHLAAVHSSSENNDAFGDGSWYSTYGEMWIGLYDIDNEGDYSWVDGTSVDYANWHYKNDTSFETCVGITTSNGTWNDVSCSTGYYAFICRGL